jgi:glycosyltransferase involved in cell wall biosynthesis
VQDYATGRFDMLLCIAKMLGVPLIAYHSGSRPEWYQGRVVKQYTIRQADQVVVSSHDELEMLSSRYQVPRERLVIILTPIDTTSYRPLHRSSACRAIGLDTKRRYVLFMGRLDDRVKRVSALVQSFAALAATHTDVDLLIVGEGPDGQRLRSLAAEMVPGRIHFPGWVSTAEVKAQLYNAADCLVLPSRSEGFPTVIGEAMACGTPVLASRVGGVAELVVDGLTGWLLEPGDDAALAACLAFVFTHPDVVASMRPQARAMAESRVAPPVVAAALRQCFSLEDGLHDRWQARSYAHGASEAKLSANHRM